MNASKVIKPLGIKPFKQYVSRLFALGLAVLFSIIAAAPAFADSSGQSFRQASERTSIQDSAKDSTSSDLSDIPNLEQMNHNSLERYFGDVPDQKKPLFNPDNGKNQQLQDPDSNKPVKIKDLKNQPDTQKRQD